jgi:hypothetical protein
VRPSGALLRPSGALWGYWYGYDRRTRWHASLGGERTLCGLFFPAMFTLPEPQDPDRTCQTCLRSILNSSGFMA